MMERNPYTMYRSQRDIQIKLDPEPEFEEFKKNEKGLYEVLYKHYDHGEIDVLRYNQDGEDESMIILSKLEKEETDTTILKNIRPDSFLPDDEIENFEEECGLRPNGKLFENFVYCTKLGDKRM